jgi:hypothetical protein
MFDFMVSLFAIVHELVSSMLLAYQSALLSGPLLVFRMFASLVGFSPWLRTLITVTVVLILAYMA